jgi:hypothetical protein
MPLIIQEYRLTMGAVSDAWRTPRAGFLLATVFPGLLLLGLLASALREPLRSRSEGFAAVIMRC